MMMMNKHRQNEVRYLLSLRGQFARFQVRELVFCQSDTFLHETISKDGLLQAHWTIGQHQNRIKQGRVPYLPEK